MAHAKELALDVLVLLFILTLSAGARHLFDGSCKDSHHAHLNAVAGASTKAP